MPQSDLGVITARDLEACIWEHPEVGSKWGALYSVQGVANGDHDPRLALVPLTGCAGVRPASRWRARCRSAVEEGERDRLVTPLFGWVKMVDRSRSCSGRREGAWVHRLHRARYGSEVLLGDDCAATDGLRAGVNLR